VKTFGNGRPLGLELPGSELELQRRRPALVVVLVGGIMEIQRSAVARLIGCRDSRYQRLDYLRACRLHKKQTLGVKARKPPQLWVQNGHLSQNCSMPFARKFPTVPIPPASLDINRAAWAGPAFRY
jgi:hypothetical protein